MVHGALLKVESKQASLAAAAPPAARSSLLLVWRV